MKVLVTGITGFAGSHLVDYMLTLKDVEIFGILRWRSRTENIEHFRDKVTLMECDLRDASSTRDVIEAVRPDRIFHLAAQSFVPTSWTAPTESLVTNIIGQLNIFEAVKKTSLKPRIQLACSSEGMSKCSWWRPLSPWRSGRFSFNRSRSRPARCNRH
jgi:GDP-4-dehydro-6-deoxy-D-mannose reductase